MLDMNTIGLFNYLTELDEEQQRRKKTKLKKFIWEVFDMMYDSIEAYSDVADNYFGSFTDDYYDAMADMYEEEGYCRFPEDFFEEEDYND